MIDFDTVIETLKTRYPDPYWSDANLIAKPEGNSHFNGFMGSKRSVSVIGDSRLTLLCGACLAARVVSVIAGNALRIAPKGSDLYTEPVKIYAPQGLTLMADVIDIGNISFPHGIPDIGNIVTKAVNFRFVGDEIPDIFDTLESWTADNTEISYLRLNG